jgi:hypothetical protein
MIEIDIPMDLMEHQENILAGMTLRQTVFAVAGVAIISTSFFFTEKSIVSEVASWLSIILGVPCFLFGFYKRDGMPLEKFFALWMESEVLGYSKRRYGSKNMYYELIFKAAEKQEAEDNKQSRRVLKKKNNSVRSKGGKK